MSFAEAQPNFTFGVIFSEPKERSSEAGSALNFLLLFFQEKSNNPHLIRAGTAGAAPIFTK